MQNLPKIPFLEEKRSQLQVKIDDKYKKIERKNTAIDKIKNKL